MMRSLRGRFKVYGAIAATTIKQNLAYNIWFWSEFFGTLISVIVYVFFWKAVYANTATLSGLDVTQTISYVLLARLLAPIVETRLIMSFGFMLSRGQVAIELTRPVDLQANFFVSVYTELLGFLLRRLPICIVAWLLLRLPLPSSLGVWMAFFVSLILGQAVVFLFDWMFASLAFYTTEVWGLSVVRIAVGSFFSGALVPLVMMPQWMQKLAAAMPFAQAISIPISIFTGITPSSEAPRIWLTQLVWLAGLWIASRWVFSRAVRKVTVQGG